MSRLFSFIGGPAGEWTVDRIDCLVGDPISAVSHVSIVEGKTDAPPPGAEWWLHGIVSNHRYTERGEKVEMVAKQEGLGRPGATRAALIPVRKTPEWWTLAQDERREIFEEQSRHIAVGMRYLPAVARRLHHCRDLGWNEPFDFLTWFEFAPDDESGFEEMLRVMRASLEWKYVEREIDIRLIRNADR